MESTSGDVTMKRLCDISNLLTQTEPANQEAKPKQLTSSVNLLVKTGNDEPDTRWSRTKSILYELQQLRTEWQDLQKQNSQLAQRYRNSWKLLVLGHMLRCRDGLLRAIKSETDEVNFHSIWLRLSPQY
ncbi:hypothetical protein QYF36_006767 [Acer negundo]|nr:hypothetical protein QYF36_006767 [Acer negundo]